MIQLSHIEKTYDSPSGPVKALKGINLTIERGEIFGIIGLSGAGKSTLIRCILPATAAGFKGVFRIIPRMIAAA